MLSWLLDCVYVNIHRFHFEEQCAGEQLALQNELVLVNALVEERKCLFIGT